MTMRKTYPPLTEAQKQKILFLYVDMKVGVSTIAIEVKTSSGVIKRFLDGMGLKRDPKEALKAKLESKFIYRERCSHAETNSKWSNGRTND